MSEARPPKPAPAPAAAIGSGHAGSRGRRGPIGRRMRSALALLLVSAMPVALAACGSSASNLIPSGNAGPLAQDFQNVANDAVSGDCPGTDTALAQTQSDFDMLPASIDQRLKQHLSAGIARLRQRALATCKANTITPTSTGTTTSTTPSATTTTPTTTPTTTSTTVTAPTTSTDTTSSNGGTGAPTTTATTPITTSTGSSNGGAGAPPGNGPDGSGPPGQGNGKGGGN